MWFNYIHFSHNQNSKSNQTFLQFNFNQLFKQTQFNIKHFYNSISFIFSHIINFQNTFKIISDASQSENRIAAKKIAANQDQFGCFNCIIRNTFLITTSHVKPQQNLCGFTIASKASVIHFQQLSKKLQLLQNCWNFPIASISAAKHFQQTVNRI